MSHVKRNISILTETIPGSAINNVTRVFLTDLMTGLVSEILWEKRSMSSVEWCKILPISRAVKRFQLIVWVIWSIHLRARWIAGGWDSRVFVSVSVSGRASVWLVCPLFSQNTLLARVLVRSYTVGCQSPPGALFDHHSSHYQGLDLVFVNQWQCGRGVHGNFSKVDTSNHTERHLSYT